jgi:hypothetical protein
MAADRPRYGACDPVGWFVTTTVPYRRSPGTACGWRISMLRFRGGRYAYAVARLTTRARTRRPRRANSSPTKAGWSWLISIRRSTGSMLSCFASWHGSTSVGLPASHGGRDRPCDERQTSSAGCGSEDRRGVGLASVCWRNGTAGSTRSGPAQIPCWCRVDLRCLSLRASAFWALGCASGSCRRWPGLWTSFVVR